MKLGHYLPIIFGFIAMGGSTAAASMLGEENGPLAAILAENIKQTFNIAETLRYVRSLTEEASDIARFTNASVKSVNNARLLLTNPVEFSQYVLTGWMRQYPEIHEIYANTIDMRLSIEELNDPEFYRHYDPYAYVRAFDALQNVERGAYEIAIRSTDKWHTLEGQDAVLKALAGQHREALEDFRQVAAAINSIGLSPQQAAVHAAKTSAISALADVEAAAALKKMTGHQQTTFLVQQSHEEAEQIKLRVMEGEAQRYRIDWRLRPAGTL